jgi:hypothetical protein
LTAFWHDPSASSAWRMNIDSVTVGGTAARDAPAGATPSLPATQGR